ncbi:MAG: DUF6572 domain-containing protein [Acidobacteriota bacterium]|jgi:CRP-like cAMP-binding protein
MTVEQTGVVDIISTDPLSGEVRLTIPDHLEWSPEHLIMLQEKINSYVRFIESGEIFSSYPEAQGRRLVINVAILRRPGELGTQFLEMASALVEAAGFGCRYGPLAGTYAEDGG